MASSPSHRFGQIIGELLEEILMPQLEDFCVSRNLYLDKKGYRGSAREGKKVTWKDKFGNSHDLDFVIEKDGTVNKRGRPLAFIEAAWRRYTKHSRNKSQEIQGAILPIAEMYSWDKPFLGTILAGVFTEGSITQMRSSGFEVMLFPYDTIVTAFSANNIDVKFDENTPDAKFDETVIKIEGLTSQERSSIKDHLIKSNQLGFNDFLTNLAKTLDRKINRVTLIPLHGRKTEFNNIADTIDFIQNYNEASNQDAEFSKYEVIVSYSNGDKIDASFTERQEAVKFLKYIEET